MADFLNEIRHIITDAFSAEVAEIGQILADLCRIQVKLLSQLLRRYGGDFTLLEIIQETQVHRQSAHHSLRYFVRFHIFSS
ncbi:hypothetical protein D3C75_1317440 [compost metagenome]